MNKKKSAFSGIKIEPAVPVSPSMIPKEPTKFESNPDPESDRNPYLRRQRGDEGISDQISKLCEKSVKAFLAHDLDKFKDFQKELIYLRSKQAVIYIDDTHQPDIHRV